MTTIQEVADVVAYLNQDMYESSSPKLAQFLEENQLSYNSNGDIIQIGFLGVLLWDSCNDPRETLEDSGEPVVPLRYFIKGRILGAIELISQIKLE